jgi:hypothetical protein
MASRHDKPVKLTGGSKMDYSSDLYAEIKLGDTTLVRVFCGVTADHFRALVEAGDAVALENAVDSAVDALSHVVVENEGYTARSLTLALARLSGAQEADGEDNGG